MTARTVYKELSRRIGKIQRLHMASRSITAEDQQQLSQWTQWIAWEKENPLHLDPEPLSQRVTFIYRMAISAIQCAPQLWLDAFFFIQSTKESTGGLELLKQASRVLPANLMINFTLADAYEGSKEMDLAKSVYESLSNQAENMSAEAMTLVWIQFMRFSRRTEGLGGARQIFGRARKSVPVCTWHLYVASGWMEYFVAKEPAIAFKIFELGMKKHAGECGFIKEYLKLLLWHMDDANARALFERALQAIPDPREQRPLWDMMIQHERDFGFHMGLEQLIDRRVQLDKRADLLAQATGFMDLNPNMVSSFNSGQFSADQISILGWLVNQMTAGAEPPILPASTPPALVELVSRVLSVAKSYSGPMLSVDDVMQQVARVSTSAIQAAFQPRDVLPPPPPPPGQQPSFLRSIQENDMRKRQRNDL